ncbi:hypothetical protein LJC31_00770, partial [Synergistaceae bacterium OttesenSCG-928-I11]|nr:hypothetical protein [Synergistaceae bacterium OttesenSCG-928-I11]
VTDDAERVGVSLSDYVRGKTLRGYVRVPKYAKIDSAHIGQLSKLGGLIKLTHNETGGIYRRETAAILEEIQGILVKIRHELERGDGNHDDRETHTEPQGT